MFKGLTKDLTGTADICNTAKDLSKLHAASYLLPGEDILFAFESGKEEFAFTNEALIMTMGESATTTRKLVQRATYRDCPISDVLFETTGRVDRDCEIKFKIGDYDVSIDIARKEEEFVKGFYKTLLLVAREQKSRSRSWNQAEKGLDEAADSLKIMTGHDLVSQATDAAAWLEKAFNERNPRCYREVITAALAQTVAVGKNHFGFRTAMGNTNSAIKGLASDIAEEEILYVLQSRREEFAFTNRALVKVSAETSTTTRKLVERFEYKIHRVENVTFESTGVVDRDCELQFQMGENKFKLDIVRDKEEEVKGFYKALVLLGHKQEENELEWQLAQQAVATAKDTVRLSDAGRQSLNQQSDETLGWMKTQYERTHPHCYKALIKSVLDAERVEREKTE
ncbi:Hypothetical protein PHPALM_8840 [Phytophthora palmivora]|uniref:Bacterial Pleckstrin homology domain-containing protein n=1 Tax=Phytophthora palmivora TaxID=4796 RepID=A0A2P4Y8U7_9STRA|nr:Hypothetical protein PHPALM_8840 [Phytophthora palmivora]